VPAVHLQDELSLQGFIGLQVHSLYKAEDAGKQVRWRNIRIQTKNLKAAPAGDIYTVNVYYPTRFRKVKRKMAGNYSGMGKPLGDGAVCMEIHFLKKDGK
jgi:hypothetical protein